MLKDKEPLLATLSLMISSRRTDCHGWFSNSHAKALGQTFQYKTADGKQVTVTEVTRRKAYVPAWDDKQYMGLVTTYVGREKFKIKPAKIKPAKTKPTKPKPKEPVKTSQSASDELVFKFTETSTTTRDSDDSKQSIVDLLAVLSDSKTPSATI